LLNNIGQIVVRADGNLFHRSVNLFVFVGDKALREDGILEMPVDGAIEKPLLSLRVSDAQVLIDDLWRCGLRPTEGAGSAGALAATQAHLKDMQRLVFDVATNRDDRATQAAMLRYQTARASLAEKDLAERERK
jgi:hypothetical protein